MSSDSAAATAEAVVVFATLYTRNYCYVAAAVLFIYDTLLTVDREVACFWPAKRTGTPLLFFVNKWISTTFYVMMLLSGAPFPSHKRSADYCGMTVNVCSCSNLLVIALHGMEILQFVPGAAFSALRAYVLSRSKLLAMLVLALSLAPVHYGYQVLGENIPPLGCFAPDITTTALDLRLSPFNLLTRSVVIISRIPLIAADILLIYITWIKLSTWGASSRYMRQSKRLSLSDILFRGGVIHFITLFFLNILHLVFTVTLVGTSGLGQSDVTIFTAPITAIMISRFLLELQEVSQTVVRLCPDDPLHSARDPFDSAPSFISSLGGSVNLAFAARSDDDDDDDDDDGGCELRVQLRLCYPEEEVGGDWATSSTSLSA
ncbi:hypothetical protein K466DRAFT_668283 [Polyporus arcularius HHB13444]|uniref:DUF6533 domain-containing protein n=1 Tax=Polyporus arcularius HHB13444 TaxID=1314778 RepID=A0A5C3NQT2_9APHY|nr:hypothetical protein K466DRAFT_668283 [Polyporus arcularius HHB13444]